MTIHIEMLQLTVALGAINMTKFPAKTNLFTLFVYMTTMFWGLKMHK